MNIDADNSLFGMNKNKDSLRLSHSEKAAPASRNSERSDVGADDVMIPCKKNCCRVEKRAKRDREKALAVNFFHSFSSGIYAEKGRERTRW